MNRYLLSGLLVILIASLGFNVSLYIDRYYSTKVLRDLMSEMYLTNHSAGARLPAELEGRFDALLKQGFQDRAEILRLSEELHRYRREMKSSEERR